MDKVIGFGGVFVLSENKDETLAWYEKHLGIKMQSWGTVFKFDEVKERAPGAYNVFSFFPKGTDYLKPSTAGFMLNLIVADLDALVLELKEEEIEILGTQNDEFGKFAWILDPNGIKIELWEPPVSE